MKILFIDTRYNYEVVNPYATLVEVGSADVKEMKLLEKQQLAVERQGGNWREIMEKGNIPFELLKEGRKSDFNNDDYDFEYKLIRWQLLKFDLMGKPKFKHSYETQTHCPKCHQLYDEKDFSYQHCSHCKWVAVQERYDFFNYHILTTEEVEARRCKAKEYLIK